jgi:DNA primase
VLHALKTHPDLQEIVLCVDNDVGGIEAAYRLRDILHEAGYASVGRLAPAMKDWNECLKAMHGASALPAVPHRKLGAYLAAADPSKAGWQRAAWHSEMGNETGNP